MEVTKQQLESLSKAALIEVCRELYGNVGDSGRTSKQKFIDRIDTFYDRERIGVAVAKVIDAGAAATNGKAVTVNGDAASHFMGMMQALAQGAVDADRIRAIAREALKDAILDATKEVGVRVIEIREQDRVKRLESRQHQQFEALLKACTARDHRGNRLNIWITGPAGSGKTTAVENVAKSLDMDFAFNGAIDTEYKLLGFTDATGRVVARPFRRIWENGGVYLFDEVDASMPSATLALNAALANGMCDFPDGAIPRHPDCIIVAAANTWGIGATSQYVGRNRLDAAFLDRFVQIAWSIDEQLETETCGDKEWCGYVQRIRKRVSERSLQGVMVTPRATYYGAALLASGMEREAVVRMTVRKSMTDDQWAQVN